MIEILKECSKEMSAKDKYALTISPKMKVVKNLDDGTQIEVNKWLMFRDTKEDTGEVTDIFSFMDNEGNSYCTQSTTLIRSFNDICTILGYDVDFTIEKISGTTKAGRPYVDIALV